MENKIKTNAQLKEKIEKVVLAKGKERLRDFDKDNDYGDEEVYYQKQIQKEKKLGREMNKKEKEEYREERAKEDLSINLKGDLSDRA